MVVIFDSCSTTMSDIMENVQRQAALAISGPYAHTTQVKLLNELGLVPLNHHRSVAKLLLLFKITRNFTPSYLKALIPKGPEPTYKTFY